jgi:hypothetical protein
LLLLTIRKLIVSSGSVTFGQNPVASKVEGGRDAHKPTLILNKERMLIKMKFIKPLNLYHY